MSRTVLAQGVRAAATLLLALSTVACGAPDRATVDTDPAAEEPVLHFANFVDEIAPETLAGFTRETGIKVVYDVYDANTMLDAKLAAGNSGFDLVVPGNNFLEMQIKAGVYQPLDRAQLPNWKHLDQGILVRLQRNDPGNRFAVPYLYGTQALGYNVAQVRAALGREPPDSWSLLFDPANASKLQQCGISILDAAWVMGNHALRYLGRDPYSESDADLAAASNALRAIRPYLREISTASLVSQYAEGDLCLFVVPSGDVRLARDQARASGTGVELRYFVPQEGALLWFDMLAIPRDAPHPGNAHKLINYLMRPDVIAKVTAATYYANANAAATALVPQALRDDPLIYPDAAMMQRLQVASAQSPGYSRKQGREFTRFKNGQ